MTTKKRIAMSDSKDEIQEFLSNLPKCGFNDTYDNNDSWKIHEAFITS